MKILKMLKRILSLLTTASMLISVPAFAEPEMHEASFTYDAKFDSSINGGSDFGIWENDQNGRQFILYRHPRIRMWTTSYANGVLDENGNPVNGTVAYMGYGQTHDSALADAAKTATKLFGNSVYTDYTMNWTESSDTEPATHTTEVNENDTAHEYYDYNADMFDGHPSVVFCAEVGGEFKTITDMSFVWTAATTDYIKTCEHTAQWDMLGGRTPVSFYVSDDLENWTKADRTGSKQLAEGEYGFAAKGSRYSFRVELPNINKKYVRIEFPYATVNTNGGAPRLSHLSLTYSEGLKSPGAEIRNSDKVAEGRSFTIDFADAMNDILPSDIKVELGGSEIAVSSVEMSEDRKSAKVILEREINSEDGYYTVTLSDGIKSEAGYGIGGEKVLSFKTAGSTGEQTLTDTAENLGKLYDYENVKYELSDKVYTDGSGNLKMINADYKSKEAYVTYKVDGSVSDFDIHVLFNNYYEGSTKAHDGKFTVYASSDGINYTAVKHDEESLGKLTNASYEFYKLTPREGAIPEGSCFIKIAYPSLRVTSKYESYLARAIDSVKLTYSRSPAGAYIYGTGTENNGAPFYADIKFINPVSAEGVKPEYFTIEESDAVCSSAAAHDSGIYRLYFDKDFEFGRQYMLVISDEFTDDYGFNLIESAKRQSVTFTKPSILIVDTENPFSSAGFAGGDTVECNLGITFNYSQSVGSRNVTVIAALYDDGILKDISSEKKTLALGEKAMYSLSLSVPADVGSDAFVRAYVLSDWQSLELLTDSFYELKHK